MAFQFHKNSVAVLAIIAGAALAGCSSSTRQSTSASALVADPEAAAVANAQPVNIANKPADMVTAIDVIRRSKAGVNRTGEIYLMRGLANVFSRGIDDMAADLRRQGYDAANFSYMEWKPIAQDIIARDARKEVSYPVIIIGHSLGGNESSKFANQLAKNGVPVSLVVAFDPVETGYVGANIGQVINYYLPKSADNVIKATPAFTGKLDNVDVTTNPSITHTNVEKYGPYQQATYTSIANITNRIRPLVAEDRKVPSR